MNYQYLEKLNIEQLKDLRDIIENNSENKEILQEKIKMNIITKEENSYKQTEFLSSRIPYYTKEYEKKFKFIMKNINFGELYFLVRTLFDNTGTRGTISVYDKISETDKNYFSKIYNISIGQINRMCCYRDYYQTLPYLQLIKVDKFFDVPENTIKYEDIYNTYNYIKNYIYQCLIENPKAVRHDIFKDYERKKEIVTDNIGAIAKYLYETREKYNLRMSVANAGLSRTAYKKGTQITYNQQIMIEAVAFGSTLEKLQVGNYEDSKRLLYLPNSSKTS